MVVCGGRLCTWLLGVEQEAGGGRWCRTMRLMVITGDWWWVLRLMVVKSSFWWLLKTVVTSGCWW